MIDLASLTEVHMKTDEYLFRSKRTMKSFAEAVRCTACSLYKIKIGHQTPGLLLAMKIVEESGGEITMADLLSTKDSEAWKKWQEEKRADTTERIDPQP